MRVPSRAQAPSGSSPSTSGPYLDRAIRFGIALLATALSVAGQLLLGPLVEPENTPFLLAYGGVFFAAWYGGLWPGVMATGLLTLATGRFMTQPQGLLAMAQPRQALPLAVFVVLALLITRLSSSLRAAYRVAEAARIEAEHARAAAESARVSAEEASKLRTDFLSIASHELRTPLTPIQLQIQSFLRQAQRSGSHGLPPERVVTRLRTIDRQLKRMTRLIEDLLDISRLTSGRLQMDVEDVDLCQVAREVIGRTSEEMSSGRSVVHLRGDGPTQVIGRWDRLRIDQIVTNLVSNAIKYGEGRPVEITVSADGGEALLMVRDHGIGIAAQDQARIFEQFERVVSGHHYGGFGLGLWIVNRIISAMGGRIEVDSQPGSGSTFTVTLPRALRRQDPAAGSHPSM